MCRMSASSPTACLDAPRHLQHSSTCNFRKPFCYIPRRLLSRSACRHHQSYLRCWHSRASLPTPQTHTVPSSQASQYAKPIQKQKTDKGFVALLFAGGAASIFGAALLLEKNSKLFPAIHKANKVMREAEKRSQGQAIAEQAVVDLEQQDDMRLQRSVEAGLAKAQARVLPDSSSSSSSNDVASTSGAAKPDAYSSQPLSQGTSSATGGRQVHGDGLEEPESSTPSSSPERSKGSQLSAADKQKEAVNSVS